MSKSKYLIPSVEDRKVRCTGCECLVRQDKMVLGIPAALTYIDVEPCWYCQPCSKVLKVSNVVTIPARRR